MKNWDCEIHVGTNGDGWRVAANGGAALALGSVIAGAVFLYFGAA
jgi:hypothetical protein